jgi:hypothetical protein
LKLFDPAHPKDHEYPFTRIGFAAFLQTAARILNALTKVRVSYFRRLHFDMITCTDLSEKEDCEFELRHKWHRKENALKAFSEGVFLYHPIHFLYDLG